MNYSTRNRMAAIGVIFILTVFSGFAFADTPTDLQPVAVIPDPDLEFSPVIEGETVTRDYLISNRGKADLKIADVHTS